MGLSQVDKIVIDFKNLGYLIKEIYCNGYLPNILFQKELINNLTNEITIIEVVLMEAIIDISDNDTRERSYRIYIACDEEIEGIERVFYDIIE